MTSTRDRMSASWWKGDPINPYLLLAK